MGTELGAVQKNNSSKNIVFCGFVWTATPENYPKFRMNRGYFSDLLTSGKQGQKGLSLRLSIQVQAKLKKFPTGFF